MASELGDLSTGGHYGIKARIRSSDFIPIAIAGISPSGEGEWKTIAHLPAMVVREMIPTGGQPRIFPGELR
jgi:hypothetical protein